MEIPIEHALQKALQLHSQGHLAQAKDAYADVLRRDPNHADALHMLGMLAGQTGNFEPCVELIERSLALKPDCPEAYNNLGNALRELGRVDQAAAAYARAVELKPDYAGVHRNLGSIYNDQGRPEQAIECYRKAAALDPHSAAIHSHLLYSLHLHPDYDAGQILAEHLAWAQQHAAPLASQIRRHANDRFPHRRLRVGYVSPDLCSHPVGRLLGPLFAHHDQAKYEISCYSDFPTPDHISESLKRQVRHWHDVYGMPDDALADKIRHGRIDILVDLAQHSGNNRMLTFARKPAPIQVAWLGYPSTTGLATMDYRLTDPYLDPPGQGDQFYSETSIRLPHCFWCYEPSLQTVEVNPLPARQNGFITFGSMNRFAKVTTPTLRLWREILQKLPTARLRTHSRIGHHLEAVKQFFQDGGVNLDRVSFVERKEVAEYLKQYHEVDVCLDPIPHGGGTTTCDALWMGVATITLSGKTAVGRGGVSILSNVGLKEFIAGSPEEYMSIAERLAGDLPALEQMRPTLRGRLAASPLMDGRQFAADIESAYRQMWRILCAKAQ